MNILADIILHCIFYFFQSRLCSSNRRLAFIGGQWRHLAPINGHFVFAQCVELGLTVAGNVANLIIMLPASLIGIAVIALPH